MLRGQEGVMDEVAPILISDYLAAPERLTLFRTSKALAVAVLQNAPLMMFAPGGLETAASDVQISTAMQLASHAAHGVALAMHHCLVTPTEAVWQRMTTLSLYDLQLSYAHCSVFRQLSTPQRLHTLCLKRCTLDFRSCRVASSSMGAPLPVRTLTYSEPRPGDTQLDFALCLVDKAQLQELTIQGPAQHSKQLPFLKQLPALQRLSLPDWPFQDSAWKVLLSHPALKSLTLVQLQLDKDHSSTRPRSLQEIRLHRSHVDTLVALPLAHLQRCIVHCFHSGPAQLETLATVMQHQDKLVFQATTDDGNWDPVAPVFRLTIWGDSERQRQAIAMCTRHLQGSLMIEPFTADTLQALQAALPATITTLCFSRFIGLTGIEGSLINHLPEHVNHVVMSRLWLRKEELQALVTGVTRRVKLTLHNLVMRGFGFGNGDDRRARFMGLVQEWLASYPNQVEWEIVGDSLTIM